MRPSRVRPLVYNSLSKALSLASNCKEVHKVHSLLITLGLDQTIFFSGKIISKYAQLKDPHSCLSVFHSISTTNNAYQWNTIIRAMTHNGLFAEALDHYAKMRSLNVKADAFTFPSVINSCAGSDQFETAILVHNHILELGFGSDLYIGNALIDMYARFSELDRARQVFEGMLQKDVVSWNSLISGYSSHGEWEEALEVFYQSRMDGIVPDSFMVASVLPACGGLVVTKEGQMIHGLSEKLGINAETKVWNGLLSMYFKLDELADCRRVFDEMVVRDTVTWNTVICGYSQAGLYQESVKLFLDMLSKQKPDVLTVTSVLHACSHIGDLKLGRYVHNYMVANEYECDVTANNILINMYAKCGYLPAAREIFDKMKCRDWTSWNSLINGTILNGQYEEAMKIYREMKMDLKPDFVTYVTVLSTCSLLRNLNLAKELHCEVIKNGFNVSLVVRNAILDMYAKYGEMEDSFKQFEIMKDRDIISWNTIIAACVHSENSDAGFRMISRMSREGLVPDDATMLGALPLCSILGAKLRGKEIHGCIFKLGLESNVPIGNALIEMYSACGSLRNSILIFDHIETRDVVTWTALICAYGVHGQGRKAINAFEDMKATGITPDHVVYIAIIYACSHSGLVGEGRAYFDEMKRDYNMEPKMEHYACVVDLLSRAGLFAEAEEFILSMPIKADASLWGSLLGACRAGGDTRIVERASKHIMELNSNDTGCYVLVSNAYASLGKWDQVKKIRKSLKVKGLKIDAGCSWVT